MLSSDASVRLVVGVSETDDEAVLLLKRSSVETVLSVEDVLPVDTVLSAEKVLLVDIVLSLEIVLSAALDELVAVVDSNELLGSLGVVVAEIVVVASDEVPDEVAIVLVLGTVGDVCEELALVSEELSDTDVVDGEVAVVLENALPDDGDGGGGRLESDV